MTSLSIHNMNYSMRYQNELGSGEQLNKLERLAVRLQVARNLQRQTGWGEIIKKGVEMEKAIFEELVEMYNTDPAHILNAETEVEIVDGVSSAAWFEAQPEIEP